MRAKVLLTLTASLACTAASALQAQTFDNGAQVYNVKASYGLQPGAQGNDTGDDGPAIQRAVNAAEAAGGGIIFLPAGTYRLQSGLSLGGGVILEGSGWNRSTTSPSGTWLHVTGTSFTPIAISFDGAGVRNLAISHDQPTPGPGWAPNPYPYTIQINGNAYGVFLHDILLLNPTKGVLQTGGIAGALDIDRLYGQPLNRGIEIDNMQDVMHVHNVHFASVWSTDANVWSYMLANAIGILSYRNDEPDFEDILFFKYLMGFAFESNASGVTNRFHISNLHCDNCYEGIRIWTASGTQGKVSNLDVENANIAGSVGVHVIDSPGVLLLLDNVHILSSGASNIYVHNALGGTNPLVMVDNLIAENWGQGWAALTAGANCNITVGFNRTFIPSNGILTGGAGTFALGQ